MQVATLGKRKSRSQRVERRGKGAGKVWERPSVTISVPLGESGSRDPFAFYIRKPFHFILFYSRVG